MRDTLRRAPRRLANLLSSRPPRTSLVVPAGRARSEGAHSAEARPSTDLPDDIVRGPWPQPSPWFPDRMIPTVLHVPEDERDDWRRNVFARYRRQLVSESAPAIAWALANPGLAPMDARRFVELVCDGPISRFLTPWLDLPDLALFGEVMEKVERARRDAPGTWFKADFRIMELVESDEESSAAPTVVLFRRGADGGYELVAIAVDEEVFTPGDGRAFELAMWFALQGAGVSVTLHMHPRLHFPHDAINAIARTRLPDGHVVKELLRPHLRLELAVSDAVLHGPRSVLRPGHVYSPYPGTHLESLRLVQTIWTGHRHRDGSESTAYPPYRFALDGPTVHSRYGTFLRRYHATTLAFVREVLAHVPHGDPHTRDFASHVASFLPGFPDGAASEDRDVLARALATAIFSVSIAHTTDHHLYGRIDPREVPFRLRARPPRRGEPVELDPRRLVTSRDLVSYRLCSAMYFRPHVLEPLVDVRYAFREPELAEAGPRFVRALRETEARLAIDGVPIYLELDRMAPSVQF